MNRSFGIGVMCLVLLVSFVLSLPAVAVQAEDEAAIRKASKQALESVNERDVKAHADVYADPFETFVGAQDRATHERNHLEGWARQKDMRVKWLDEIGLVFLSPEVAIHKYRQETTGALDDDGDPLPPRETLIARVYAKINGAWVTKAVFTQPVE